MKELKDLKNLQTLNLAYTKVTAAGLKELKELKNLRTVELFVTGGEATLNAIERQGFDVLSKRPTVGKGRKMWLLLKAVAGRLMG